MARSTNSQGNSDVFAYIGILLFLPFLMISIISFSTLKRKYLAQPSIQRVMDIRRLAPLLLCTGGIMAVAAYFTIVGLGEWGKSPSFVLLVAGPVLLGVLICSGYLVARHLAVLYFGIVADTQAGILYFPYDMNSYGIMDYLSLCFVRDFCRVDSVPLAAIERITRGGRGKDLYLHGAFGSRGITMSSKQKRDECIAMVQALSGRRGLVAMEVEGC